MALTKKQTKSLLDVLYHAKRAATMITREDVAFCRKGGPATTTLHYTRADGSVMQEMAKDIGSDLCGIEFAIRGLERFIESDGKF